VCRDGGSNENYIRRQDGDDLESREPNRSDADWKNPPHGFGTEQGLKMYDAFLWVKFTHGDTLYKVRHISGTKS